LDRKQLEDTLKYIDDFYSTINGSRRLEARMIKDCRRLGF
jgi:hypothetical protein